MTNGSKNKTEFNVGRSEFRKLLNHAVSAGEVLRDLLTELKAKCDSSDDSYPIFRLLEKAERDAKLIVHRLHEAGFLSLLKQ